MANPTTNYGFVLPTSTDLVTDLPADFDVALQGVDTRLKALQPGTTEGDLAYSSATANTNNRLGIGSTGDVLTVAGGVPTWATASAPGANWTLLNAGGTLLTGATTITVSGISGADKIMVVIGESVSSANASSEISLRFNTDSGSNYRNFGSNIYYPSAYDAGMQTRTGDLTSTRIPIFQLGGSASGFGAGYYLISGANAAGVKVYNGLGGVTNTGNNATQYFIGGIYNSATVISSISIVSSTGNFDTGSVYVYTSA
jgi:hypothetical protein